MNTSIIVSQDTRQMRKDNTFPIILRITHHQKTTSIKTGICVSEQDWNAQKREVRQSYKGSDNVTRINNIIASKKKDANSIIMKLEETGQLNSLSIVELRNRIVGNKSNGCFLTYTQSQIELLNQSERFGSARAYKCMSQVVKKFHNKDNLPFFQLSSAFLRKLEVDYLSRGNSYNGLASILRSLRAVYNKAIKDGLTEKTSYPFDDYRIKKTPTAKRAISQEALNKILEANIETSHELWNCRNYFLFSYLSFGMNFGDMASIRIRDIVDGRIHYTRRKTKQVYDIKILEQMQPIIEFYRTNKAKDDFLFPIIKRKTNAEQDLDIQWARQRYNKDLKLLAKESGIQENLTSYVTRHSAATRALHIGVPVAAISRLLGHSSIAVTQTYLKSLPDNVIDSYQELLSENLGKK